MKENKDWEARFDTRFPEQAVEHYRGGRGLKTYHIVASRNELISFIEDEVKKAGLEAVRISLETILEVDDQSSHALAKSSLKEFHQMMKNNSF